MEFTYKTQDSHGSSVLEWKAAELFGRLLTFTLVPHACLGYFQLPLGIDKFLDFSWLVEIEINHAVKLFPAESHILRLTLEATLKEKFPVPHWRWQGATYEMH